MEVTVLDAQNTPKKPVVSIRVGSALRHADLALNTPFHVPPSNVPDSNVKVSLYEQLGTQTIPDADEPESICNVPIRTPDGTCSQVTLRIRRGQTNMSLANAKRSTLGVEAYLDTHQLEARLQGLFETVLKKQPIDPYRCMIEELQKARSPAACAAASEAGTAKVPVPPGGPRPQNARPSPAAKGRNVKPSEPDSKTAQEDADTKAALAQIMNNSAMKEGFQESRSLGGARQHARSEAVKALGSSRAMAFDIMRHCLCRSAGEYDPGIFPLGEKVLLNRKVSHCVVGMVLGGASARIQARSLGILPNSKSSVSGTPSPCAIAEKAVSAENKELCRSLRDGIFRKASVKAAS